MITAEWAGVAVLLILSLVGWVIAYVKNIKGQANAVGRTEEKVNGLCTAVKELRDEVSSLHGRCSTLDRHYARIEGLFNGMGCRTNTARSRINRRVSRRHRQ